MENVRTRGFRFLLYPDNRDHMLVLKSIKRDPDFHKYYVGIWHQLPDTKKHSHVILYFDNPRSWKNICKSLNCDERFCRPIGYEVDKKSPDHWKRCSKKDNIVKACAYLPHYTDLDKEQYSLSDLWGYPSMVEWCKKNCISFQARNLSQADCLLAVRSWIVTHWGQYIRSMQFVSWITGTPYMKVINSGIVQRMINDHNASVAYQEDCKYEDDLDSLRAAAAAQREKEREFERDLLAAGFYSIETSDNFY